MKSRTGRKNKWSQHQYAAATDKLRTDTKQGLRKGKIKCH